MKRSGQNIYHFVHVICRTKGFIYIIKCHLNLIFAHPIRNSCWQSFVISCFIIDPFVLFGKLDRMVIWNKRHRDK
ncbi:hypothetical protein BDA99DRAFT_500512 [Phascolomyces articulosus]|uniref:Uncharacterized protein n=1 Tax=Phascolomyces articulosus TaxID=60185 RepID=A0AAD5PGQ1_9FUNG|nr:hypothetical protein BDA99DRAFT_500512 [Phascolomyces articulosus]